jgi:hypothetical protein
MVEFIGFRATMMKALIHASGDGYPAMKSLALLGLDTSGAEFVNSRILSRSIEAKFLIAK